MRFAYSVSFDFFVYARTFTVDCLRYVFSVSRSSRAFRLSYFVSAVVRPRSVGDRGKSCANDDGRMIASFPFPTMIVFGSDYPLRSLRTFVNAARSVAYCLPQAPKTIPVLCFNGCNYKSGCWLTNLVHTTQYAKYSITLLSEHRLQR